MTISMTEEELQKLKRIFPEWTPFIPHSGSRSKDMSGHVFSNGSKILSQGERDSSGAATFYVECKVPGCSNVSRTRAADLRKNISDKNYYQCKLHGGHAQRIDDNLESKVGTRKGQLLITKLHRSCFDKTQVENSFTVVCDCGKEMRMSAAVLTNRNSCSENCEARQELKRKYIGQKIERLLIKDVQKGSNVRSNGDQHNYFVCDCDCGEENVKISAHSILSGRTNSCGCFGVERKTMWAQMCAKYAKQEEKESITSERIKLARSGWKKKVYSLKGDACCACSSDSITQVHHVYNFSLYEKLRDDVDNGIVFCSACHREFHEKHGFSNNNIFQIADFKNSLVGIEDLEVLKKAAPLIAESNSILRDGLLKKHKEIKENMRKALIRNELKDFAKLAFELMHIPVPKTGVSIKRATGAKFIYATHLPTGYQVEMDIESFALKAKVIEASKVSSGWVFELTGEVKHES